MLRDEGLVGLHAALTPTWNETAELADLVLPMGLSPERHDLQSQETHSARWIVFRQPVRRVAAERAHGEECPLVLAGAALTHPRCMERRHEGLARGQRQLVARAEHLGMKPRDVS